MGVGVGVGGRGGVGGGEWGLGSAVDGDETSRTLIDCFKE